MFITSFGEQNITYKCCSNFLIHLSTKRYLQTRSARLNWINQSGIGDVLNNIEIADENQKDTLDDFL